jgi:hypothetical protein
VELAAVMGNGFNRFRAETEAKPLKRLVCGAATNTGLKPGANERLKKLRDAQSQPAKHRQTKNLPAP